MRSSLHTYLALVAFGYATGALGRYFHEPVETEGPPSPVAHNQGRSAAKAPFLTDKSSDTAETLAEIPANDLYPRLVLWLLDADASDIEGFWASYSVRPDRNHALTELIFINWTRLDPEGAITATRGTEFERYPWSTWACNDPDKALARVIAEDQRQPNNKALSAVAQSLGKFQPTWLREHLDKLPDSEMKQIALGAYVKFADTETPRESIEFLKRNNWTINNETLAAFALENPLEAFELTMELKNTGQYHRYQNQPGDLVVALADQDPALLDQIIPRLKSPEAKLKAQTKQFEALLKTDPDAAEMATLETPPGWARQDQLAALGEHYLESNPTKAREIAVRLLQQKGELTKRTYQIDSPGSSKSIYSPEPPAKNFLDQLIHKDPQALMDAALSSTDGEDVNRSLIERAWADQDLPGFADWASKQEDPEIYRTSATHVTYKLIHAAQFSEAMEWAQSLPVDDQFYSFEVTQAYRHWLDSDPETARAWREKTTLSEAQNDSLNSLEKQAP